MTAVAQKISGAVHKTAMADTEPGLSIEAHNAFYDNSSTDASGVHYMTQEQFIDAVSPRDEDFKKITREQYGILFHIADTTKQNKLSLSDWARFDRLLNEPDAEYTIAFKLFDVTNSGSIHFKDFLRLYNLNKSDNGIPFDWNSAWARLYLGGGKSRHDMSYPQFCQMVRGLQGEKIRQAFQLFDKNQDGYISPDDFQRIIMETSSHKLSDHLLENLTTLCHLSEGSDEISYADVRAFNNVMREMDLISMIVRNAASKSKDGKVSRADFLDEASRSTRFVQITPMEADILFHFAGLDDPKGRLTISEFAKVLDDKWRNPFESEGFVEQTQMGKVLHEVLESAHHFALGSLAGAFGAFMVYPIDLVKTRMQNQRKNIGVQVYKNSLDCAQKVLQREGFRGFYSGVIPQLIGVAPEKAIKLTVNDLVRGRFTDPDTGIIPVPFEILAGGSAGACQVIFTNPLEIVKIRLQMQGEVAKSLGVDRKGAFWIMRNLGLRGLYKGCTACLSRDVPFSAIYFPTYAHLKRDLFKESPENKLGVGSLLISGAIAGMPAAYLTTPFDVVKTRLQTEARKGESNYLGFRHAFKTIYAEEGFRAFFKGGPARILRSSPQFGFTLAAYEVLQNALPMPNSDKPRPTIGMSDTGPLPGLRSRNALKVILDLDVNFGRIKLPEGKPKGWLGLSNGSKA